MVRAAQQPTPGARVLLVEDHEDTLDLYRACLEFHGFTVHQARNGWEAIIQARAFQPDLIVMDLNLPGLDGWSATQHLKGHPETRHMPVIAVSGYTMLEGERRARQVGCDRFLPKPCLPDDLIEAVRDLLSRSRSPVQDRREQAS